MNTLGLSSPCASRAALASQGVAKHVLWQCADTFGCCGLQGGAFDVFIPYIPWVLNWIWIWKSGWETLPAGPRVQRVVVACVLYLSIMAITDFFLWFVMLWLICGIRPDRLAFDPRQHGLALDDHDPVTLLLV